MMPDYGYVFAINLQRNLKNRIKGKIYVTVLNEDVLMVKVENDGVDIRVYIEDFADRIQHGWSSDYAVYEVLREYRKAIMDKYFYND